jgi:endo-1,4-beta-mannosidase
MSKNPKIKRAQKKFIEAMKKKFSEDNTISSKTMQNRKPVDDHVTLIPYKDHIFESMDDFTKYLEVDPYGN